MPPAVTVERFFTSLPSSKATVSNLHGNCFEPMRETELLKILTALSEATTPNARKNILFSKSSVCWITCKQLGRIFYYLPFPAERRFATTLFAPKIIDRYHRQQDLFSSLKCDTPTEKSILHDIILQRR
ncbi:hypothetical protein K7432_002275 [Basidiobolus ranarum]|uniref:Uncharacterized protein n=1 Tax=Basidiobolus ranarum TaxID=34480 RepID=A0ABR2X1R3_9FUNG